MFVGQLRILLLMQFPLQPPALMWLSYIALLSNTLTFEQLLFTACAISFVISVEETSNAVVMHCARRI